VHICDLYPREQLHGNNSYSYNGRRMKRLVLLLLLTLSGCRGGSNYPPPDFDIPSLIGIDFDQVRATLGPQDDDEKGDPGWDGPDTNAGGWTRNERGILVNYRDKSRQITEIFITCRYDPGSCTDQDELLAAGNLKREATNYRVEFVESAGDPGIYLGVRVFPIK
jgi:hypothetical protein